MNRCVVSRFAARHQSFALLEQCVDLSTGRPAIQVRRGVQATIAPLGEFDVDVGDTGPAATHKLLLPNRRPNPNDDRSTGSLRTLLRKRSGKRGS